MSEIHNLYNAVKTKINEYISSLVDALRVDDEIGFVRTAVAETIIRAFVAILSLAGSIYELFHYATRLSFVRIILNK